MKRIVNLIVVLFLVSQLSAQGNSYLSSEKYKPDLFRTDLQKVDRKTTRDQKLQNLMTMNKMFQEGAKTQALQRLDSFSSETFNGTWIPDYKLLFTWNSSSLVTKQEEFNYNDSSSQWIPTFRETYEYSPGGDPVKITSELYNEITSQWEGDQKTEYTWNGGNIETEMIWYWDLATSGWLEGRKGTYAYNTTGLLTSIIWEYWDETISQWYIGYMEQYSYNASNLVVQILYSMWNSTQQIYEAMGKDEFQYHTNGKVSLYMASFFDTYQSQWIPEWKTEYSYDGQGNNTLMVESSYDVMISQWIFTNKSEKTFDVNNNLVTRIYSSFDENSSQWYMQLKGEFTYNNNYAFNDLQLPFMLLDDESRELLNHMLTNSEYSYYDDVSQTWNLNETGEFFWTQLSINIAKVIRDLVVKVYPNPVSDFITIDMVKGTNPVFFELFDIHGRMVISSELSDNNIVPVGNFKSGIYLYKITDGQNIIKQDKLIINK